MKLNLTMFSLTVLAATSAAVAGTKDGGGGKGILCGTHLRTLDIYEAEEVYHLPLPPSAQLDLNSNLVEYGLPLLAYFSASPINTQDPTLAQPFLDGAQKDLISHFVDIQPGTRLDPTFDATVPSLPPACAAVQVAVYSDDGNIYRDRQYWDLLDVRNQAALILHEALYHSARQQGAKTSDETRKFIGLTFANELPEPILKPIWNAPRYLWCGVGGGSDNSEIMEIFAKDDVKDGQKGVSIYFPLFKGMLEMARTSAFVPNVSIDEVTDPSEPMLQGIASNSSSGNSWNFEMDHSNIAGNSPSDHFGGIQIRAWAEGEAKPVFSSGICEFYN